MHFFPTTFLSVFAGKHTTLNSSGFEQLFFILFYFCFSQLATWEFLLVSTSIIPALQLAGSASLMMSGGWLVVDRGSDGLSLVPQVS